MRKLIIAVLVLISLDSFAQPTNYTWYKQRIRQYSLMLDSMLYIPRYNGTPSGVRVNENSAIDGAIAVDTANGRQYFYYNGSWRRLANYSELGVDSIWRVPGTDSIFWSKSGNTYKIKDSTGGGSTPTLQQVLTAGSTLTTDNTIDAGGNDLIFNNIINGEITASTHLGIVVDNIGLDISTNQIQVLANIGTNISDLFVNTDSIQVRPHLGQLNIDSLRTWSAVADTTYKKPMTWDTRNGRWERASSWFGSGGGSSDITVGTTVVNSGTNKKFAYNAAGVYGESAMLSQETNQILVSAPAGSTTTPFYVNDSEDNTGYSAEFGKAGIRKIGLGTDGFLESVDISAPSTPSSGYGRMYVRADSLRFKNDAGTEFTLGISAGGSGTVNTGTDKRVAYYSGTGTTVDDAAGFEIGNTNNRVYIQCQSTTEVPLIIQSVSSQTADMFQLKNSSGTVTASVYADGSRFGFGKAADGVDGVVQILNQFGMANSLTWTDGATSGGYIRVSGSMSFIGTSNGSDFGFVYNGSEKARVNSVGVKMNGRFAGLQGADVASANNLTLGNDGNTFEITGSTQINLITNTNWQNGSEVTLLLPSGITVKHGQTTSGSNITILLNGAADFVTAAAASLTLVYSEFGGTNAWREVSRVSY